MYGAGERNRTINLLITNQLLCLLSYTSIYCPFISATMIIADAAVNVNIYFFYFYLFLPRIDMV